MVDLNLRAALPHKLLPTQTPRNFTLWMEWKLFSILRVNFTNSKFSLLLSLHLINSTLLGFVNFKRWKSGGGSWMKRYSSLTEWWKVQSWHKIKVTVIHSVIGIGKHHISKFNSALLQKLLFSNSFQLYQHIASKIVESFILTTSITVDWHFHQLYLVSSWISCENIPFKKSSWLTVHQRPLPLFLLLSGIYMFLGLLLQS